ncbi:unnamed protein product [Penicillium camemberti]|uniref:Str. FM013 n=1 Tax=Penicillium camemberti (strain FM 013) TaxID=1429867 RepID=A0A0G4PBJ2_PENC3|nr:unnamed protein product [Penicillium camemberti]
MNSYLGCGCDKFALQPEIHQYFVSVANKYNLRPHMRFDSVVKSAE